MAVTELMKIYKKAKKRGPAQALPKVYEHFYDYVKTPRPNLEIVPDAPPLEPPPGGPTTPPLIFPSKGLTGLGALLYSPDLNAGEDAEVARQKQARGIRSVDELQTAPDFDMALKQAKGNSAAADVFKNMMGKNWTRENPSGPGADPMGQSNDWDSRIQMGQFRNAAGLDEDTNLKIMGRGMGAKMTRGPSDISFMDPGPPEPLPPGRLPGRGVEKSDYERYRELKYQKEPLTKEEKMFMQRWQDLKKEMSKGALDI